MSLPNIDSAGLFDVRGKSAVIVGATGAFGKVACATLGAAGARLTIAAGKAAELTHPRRGTRPISNIGCTRWPRPEHRGGGESIVMAPLPPMAAWTFWSLPRE
jgi:NAD(P)-dependent dehydrogenase (short-subunit alcohol dehydrogenase family)